MYFYTPTFEPVGGVVKTFDYVTHALALGYSVTICCPERFSRQFPLFQLPRFRNIPSSSKVRFKKPWRVRIDTTDLVFFSWPKDFELIEPRMAHGTVYDQVIHIIQSIRHVSPSFMKGYARRLLSRPLSRIMINEIVHDACNPYLNRSSLVAVIPLGHYVDFFGQKRHGGLPRPIKVGYTTWKSDFGDRLVNHLRDETELFTFYAIRNQVDWNQLREFYQRVDVFLATPLAEEGFYLPGLEAMAAGALVISSDAGGNRAYCRFGDNCVYAEFENINSYADALRGIASQNPTEIAAMRNHAYQTLDRHRLSKERDLFAEFLRKLASRIDNQAFYPRFPTNNSLSETAPSGEALKEAWRRCVRVFRARRF